MNRQLQMLAALAGLALLGGPAAHAAEDCNIKLGKSVFETKCVACHSLTEHKVGPRLDHLLGRRAGSVKGFDFSPALASANFRWDVERLSAFLNNPQEYVPGTAMAFRGVQWKEERDALVCYVRKAK